MHGGAKLHRSEAEDERARAAWLLSIDLADQAAAGAGFLKVYDMPGKRGRGSAEDVSMGRRLALYLATTVADVPCRPLAKAAGVHHSTVAHHVERVADLRDDDPKMDQLLDELERKLIFRAASLVMARLGYEFGEAAA